MYKIYADSQLIYSTRLPERSITSGLISLEAGRSGTFVFTMLPTNPYYDTVQKLKSIIRVERDGEQVFRGRVYSITDSITQEKTFTCESELSFLLDSIQRPFSWAKSPRTIFEDFITAHNADVETAKEFVAGEVTIDEPDKSIAWKNETYESTLENLNKLVERFGGYLHVTRNQQGKSVLNWFGDFPHTGDTQTIEFGENLLDFTRDDNAEDLATALIPLGAKYNVEEGGEEIVRRVTIAPVNQGVDYVYDQDAVTVYGWIFKVEEWDDIISESALKTAGEARLAQLVNPVKTIELTALDLSKINKDIKAFFIGDYITVISKPHHINQEYLLAYQNIDLLNPENDTIVLGGTRISMSYLTLMNTLQGLLTSDKVGTIEAKEQ